MFKAKKKVVEKLNGFVHAQCKMLGNFLKNERKLVEFDKDVFMKLITKVVVKSKNEITFVFNDGTEVKAEMQLLD